MWYRFILYSLWRGAVRTILISFLFVLMLSDARAACECRCERGMMRPFCDSQNGLQIICAPTASSPATPSVRAPRSQLMPRPRSQSERREKDSPARPQMKSEMERVLELQKEFRTGRISRCSLVEFNDGRRSYLLAVEKDGWAMLHLAGKSPNRDWIPEWTHDPTHSLNINDLNDIARIKHVLRYGDGPSCIVG